MANTEPAYRWATPLIDAHKHLVLLGLIFIAISIGTWAVDLMGLVYPCPFCRAQRTAIGILGLINLLLRVLHPFIARYLALAVGGFGFVVGATQHFAGWRRIHAGEFELHEQWWIDPFLLSGCALLILALQLMIIFEYNPRRRD
ncbi:MAG TPA: hypothetical protein PLS69_05185 [Terricaulis sp.]|nr:hypothetical protein [Terricaulis sp.]HRP10291.1 hypothetical protein [Terricaulis sp.]